MGERNLTPKKPKEKRVTTRKIGNCTYIVSSSFKDGKERDIVSTITRLIQHENTVKPGVKLTN